MIRLNHRKHLLLISIAALLAAWALLGLVVKPALSRLETLRRVIPQRQATLEKINAGSKKYLTLRDQYHNLHKRAATQPENFEVLTFLDSTIEECDLQKKLALMTQTEPRQIDSGYRQTLVRIELKNLTLQQLVRLLTRVQASKSFTTVKNLHIQKVETEENLLDVELEISNLTTTDANNQPPT